jgi:hypothetical protein
MAHRLSDDKAEIVGKRDAWKTRLNKLHEAKPEAENGRPIRGDYTLSDVEMALGTLALNGSNYSRTSSELKEQYNLQVHPQTLKGWALQSFPRKYAEIQHQIQDHIGEDLASKLSDNAMGAVIVQSDTIERLSKHVDDLDVKDLANVARNLAQTTSLNTEKARLLRDQPTKIVEHKDPEEIILLKKKIRV